MTPWHALYAYNKLIVRSAFMSPSHYKYILKEIVSNVQVSQSRTGWQWISVRMGCAQWHIVRRKSTRSWSNRYGFPYSLIVRKTLWWVRRVQDPNLLRVFRFCDIAMSGHDDDWGDGVNVWKSHRLPNGRLIGHVVGGKSGGEFLSVCL